VTREIFQKSRHILARERFESMVTTTDIVTRSDVQRANAQTAATLARHCPPETPNLKPGEEIVRGRREFDFLFTRASFS